MVKKIGLLSYGVYLPRRRLERSAIYASNKWFSPGLKSLARGQKAISNWDEDPITMAVEAGRRCLQSFNSELLERLSLASTTLPFADRSNAGLVKEAMNLNDNLSVSDRFGSLRAGSTALLDALSGSGQQLCLAADRRRAKVASIDEMNQGDAAAAILVGEGELIATHLGGLSRTLDFVDHFRSTSASYDYSWEPRFAKDEGYQKILATAIKDCLAELGLKGEDIDHAAIAVTARGVAPKLAAMNDIPAEALVDTMMTEVGDAGAAHATLMLATALQQAKPKQKILVASFGQGADVMVFETTKKLEQINKKQTEPESLSDSNYMRFLFHRGLLDIDKGMRAELDEKQPGTSLARDRKTVLGLVGGKCTETGVVQFPKTELAFNGETRVAGQQEDYFFAHRKAKVVSYTADVLTYSADPPAYYGMIDFDGGGRMVAEFADVEEGDVDVGTQMRMVFRIKSFDEQRGFRKYFWKATPIR